MRLAGPRAEPLDAQALVAQAPVEASIGTVLPSLARIDQRRGDATVGDPLEDRSADELWPVVRAQEDRRSVRADETREHVDHPLEAVRACHVDDKALVGELVDYGQALDLLALGGFTGINSPKKPCRSSGFKLRVAH